MSYNSLLINKVDLVDHTIDPWGEPIDVVTKDVVCRIMYGNKLVRNFAGEQVLSFAKIFLKADQTITHTMEVIITDPDTGTKKEHPIIKIAVPQDSTKRHHREVWIS